MSTEIEARLRAAWDAAEGLLAPADDPPLMVIAARRSWRAPLLAAAAVLVIAVGVTAAANWPTTRRPVATHASTPPPDVTPAVVLESARNEIQGMIVHRLDQPFEWVQTTVDQWDALEAGQPIPAQPTGFTLYVTQIRGDFDCRSCKIIGPDPHGTTMVGLIPLIDNPQYGRGFILGKTSYDLSKIGTVHTFQLK